MLRKLLKYDITDALNRVILIYGGVALLCALAYRLFDLFPDSALWDFVSGFCFGAAISMAVTMLINVIIHAWVNFKTTVYGDRGYLTHTLPITKRTVYNSKLLSAFCALALGIAVTLITLLILLFSDAYLEIIKELFGAVSEIYQMDVSVLLIVVAAELLVQTFALIQSGLIGIILGHRFPNAKGGLSFVFGLIAYMISQGTALIIMLAAALVKRDMLSVFFSTEAPTVSVIKAFLLVGIIAYAAVNVIFYFVATKTFNKGVNLD